MNAPGCAHLCVLARSPNTVNETVKWNPYQIFTKTHSRFDCFHLRHKMCARSFTHLQFAENVYSQSHVCSLARSLARLLQSLFKHTEYIIQLNVHTRPLSLSSRSTKQNGVYIWTGKLCQKEQHHTAYQIFLVAQKNLWFFHCSSARATKTTIALTTHNWMESKKSGREKSRQFSCEISK